MKAVAGHVTSILGRMSSCRKSLARQPGHDGAVQVMQETQDFLIELRKHAKVLAQLDGNRIHCLTPEEADAWFWVQEVGR